MDKNIANKNVANFTEDDKWLLANMVSVTLSINEVGRLGIKLYLDSLHARGKYRLFDHPEIVTFEHLFNALLNGAYEIEAFWVKEPIELLHKQLKDRHFGKFVEEQCKQANGSVSEYLKMSASF